MAGLVLLVVAFASDPLVGDESSPLGEAALAALVYAAVIVGVGGLVELAVRRLPARALPLALAATLLPALGVLGALGLPELLIHYWRDEPWSYRAGFEVSVAALGLAGAASATVAWRSAYPALGIVAVAVVTVAMATVGRDLGVRELDPSWCYADQVFETGDSGFYGQAEGGCTLVLPYVPARN